MARLDDNKCPHAINTWQSIIDLVQLSFTDGGNMPDAFGNGILVLVPKPDKSFWGIALLETVYKLVSLIIHRRLSSSIQLHDAVHGFRKQRGTGTAIMNVKLLLQKTQRKSEPLYMLFLDIKKAYDTLDRDRTISLLRQYGVGDNICNIIQTVWSKDTMIP
jgi:Reverse transcriptase (RNA-dependent DNA polymerase)